MTLPIEKSWSLSNTRKFLIELLDPKKTPRVPKHIREKAYRCLKHYPGEYDIKNLAKKCPNILQYTKGK